MSAPVFEALPADTAETLAYSYLSAALGTRKGLLQFTLRFLYYILSLVFDSCK